MIGSMLSRRVSEVVGVALFAAALIWLIALASYDANDPVWFFSTGTNEAPANFVGRVGAFLAELSFQLLGYASYLIPLLIAVAGWHYFWCREIAAIYTKAIGTTLVLACASAFMHLALGSVDLGDRSFRAGGYLGESLAEWMAEYLSRTGSIIVILAVLVAAVILATQFSFGRLFTAVFSGLGAGCRSAWTGFRAWIVERRRARQRRDVIAKHVKKGTASPELLKAAAERATRAEPAVARPKPALDDDEPPARPSRATPPVVQKKAARAPVAPPLPLTDPEPIGRGPAERRNSGFTLPPGSLLDPPRAERKIDERELMESARLLEEKCREFSVEGAVVQIHPGPVVTTFEFKPDAGV